MDQLLAELQDVVDLAQQLESRSPEQQFIDQIEDLLRLMAERTRGES